MADRDDQGGSRGRADRSAARGQGLPAHVTMPLLDRITRDSSDYDYRVVAERVVHRSTPSRHTRRARTLLVLAVFALLLVTAGVETARSTSVDEASRTTLVSQVQRQRERLAENQQRRAELESAVAGLRARAARLRREQRQAEQRVQQLGVVTGHAAVQGPGVRATVKNPEVDDPVYAVRDEDLAMLVDGLWNAGAEAIAVNGERLTVRSAFRNAGAAIRVNQVTLSPPYVVEAIGETNTLQARLAESPLGLAWLSLVQQLDFGFSMKNVESLTLPAEPLRTLREVEVLTEQAKEGQR